MKLLHKYTLFISLIIGFGILFSNCAVIVPPGGGPKDSLPPNLISSTPGDSSVNFTGKKIELIFDEYITVENAQQELIVSPTVQTMPLVSSYLEKITIEFKEPLEPNTTYSFNFGKSIKDANEGNPYQDYTYALSTGNVLDTGTISGRVVLAETGLADSTMLAVLYTDLSDTAIYKNMPRYYTRLDSAGNFEFNFLPQNIPFHLFAVENSYMRNYADSTKLFAYYGNTITASQTDSVPLVLYAYREFEDVGRPRRITENQLKKQREEDAKKPLTVAVSAKNEAQSLLDDLYINFSKPLRTLDAAAITLTDTNNVPVRDYTIEKSRLDSNYSSFALKRTWPEDAHYILIVPPEAAVDSFDVRLTKADTTLFKTKTEREYASFTMTFPDVDMSLNPVVLLFKNNTIVDSMKIGEDKRIIRSRYEPGEYEMRILYDTNNNMRWDPGSYSRRTQPEMVVTHKKVIAIRANWENEIEIFINQ